MERRKNSSGKNQAQQGICPSRTTKYQSQSLLHSSSKDDLLAQPSQKHRFQDQQSGCDRATSDSIKRVQVSDRVCDEIAKWLEQELHREKQSYSPCNRKQGVSETNRSQAKIHAPINASHPIKDHRNDGCEKGFPSRCYNDGRQYKGDDKKVPQRSFDTLSHNYRERLRSFVLEKISCWRQT